MGVISLNTNVSSLRAQRQLTKVTSDLSSTFERLSSGLRINHASDDPAGLAVASSLQNDRRVFNQGVRNLNDGVSLLNVAEGAVEQLSTIVTRLQELAEQSANGIYGQKQRKSLDDEAQALSAEYIRIARTTTFNGRTLFSADFGQLRVQGGYGAQGGIQYGLGGGVGLGTFGSATNYTSSYGAAGGVVMGDLNGDGIMDIASAEQNGVTVHLGLGGGVFGTATTFAAGPSFVAGDALALGDVNGDGILDIVKTSRAVSGGLASILIGRGDGSFQAGASYLNEANGTYAVSLKDLNNDGVLDLITGGDNGYGLVTVRLGLGNGTFGVDATYDTHNATVSVLAFGDINRDGILDFVAGGQSGGSGPCVLFGNGDGTFYDGGNYSVGNDDESGLALGDYNEDGFLDVAVTSTGSGDFVSILFNGGNGTFGAARTVGTGDGAGLASGDLNGDGHLDLVTTNFGGTGFVRLGNGDGTFRGGLALGSSGTSLALGDLNGDGVLDIASTGSDMNVRFSNTTTGIAPLLGFSLRTRADALQALSQFSQAQTRLSVQRGAIGAFQSRLGVAGSVLQTSSENYAAAVGQIADADIAEESAKLVRSRILQQAAAAVLAQANQQPALAITLIGK